MHGHLNVKFVARLLKKFYRLLQNPLNHYLFYHSPSLVPILSKKNRHPVSLTLDIKCAQAWSFFEHFSVV